MACIANIGPISARHRIDRPDIAEMQQISGRYRWLSGKLFNGRLWKMQMWSDSHYFPLLVCKHILMTIYKIRQTLRTLVINFQSLRSKKAEFWNLLHTTNPDIILGSDQLIKTSCVMISIQFPQLRLTSVTVQIQLGAWNIQRNENLIVTL